jgi:thermitase
MNKKIAILAALFAALALAGCNLASQKSVNDLNSASPSMTEYRTFSAASEEELAVAANNGFVNAGYVIAKASRDFDPARFTAMGATVAGSFEIDGFTYYRLYKKDGAVKLLARLGTTKGIAYAQHELLSTLPANESSSGAADETVGSRDAATIAAFFNDPMTWGRFGHFETTHAIDAYKADDFGANTVYVVDVDTGIRRTHEDFIDGSGNQIVEYAKSAFGSTDGGATFSFVGDGNSFVTVPVGENWDDIDHGTHTAGTIAALGNNGKGVAGVCWKNVKLISYKCFCDHTSNGGSGSDWAIYGALADVVAWKTAHSITQTIPVNMSLGGSMAGPFELEMINYALKNDVVVIASMGNDGYNRAQYPAAYTGVIAIGATRANGTKVHFSVSGSFISVSAPGYDIYSVGYDADDSYIDMSGTSMAAPFVTGTVAYLLTFNPTLKPDQIKTILESTANDMGAAGWDEDTGYGQVDVKKAADIVKAGTAIPVSGSVYSTKTITFSVVNTNANYDSGLGAGLESAVTGQPVYVYDATGACVYVGLTNGTDGSVEFRLLKPGDYTARTNYFDNAKSQAFTVDGSDHSYVLSFDVPILLIQTVPNNYFSSGATGADSIITLYDSTGTTVLAGPYDKGSLDTLTVSGLTSGTTYLVKVEPYKTYYGEYAFDVGFAGITSANVAPNPVRAENAADGYGTTAATATPVTLDTPISACLASGGEWFSFTMP